MRVLITRPAAEGKATAARLAARGHQPICAPALELVALRPEFSHGAADAAIVTSARAFGALGEDLGTLSALPLYVVGERSAQRARTLGWTRIETVARDAAELLPALLSRPASIRWLYLAGAPRSPELERELRAAGRALVVALAYEARPAPRLPAEAARALAGGDLDAVLHYSAHSAACFVELTRAAGLDSAVRDVLHVAISARAAKPLRPAARRIRIAARPDEQGLIEKLEENEASP